MRLVCLLACLCVCVMGIAPAQAAQAVPGTVAPTPTEPTGFRYDSGGRRDPFVSLLNSGTDGDRLAMGSRPQGLAGLSASEVALKGTLNSRTGFVALVQGADNRTYIVRPGDELLDGTIQTITEEAMVILQQVDDPLSLQKERAVRKSLRQAEESK